MIKLGLSIEDDMLEEELPPLVKDDKLEETPNRMEDIDWVYVKF